MQSNRSTLAVFRIWNNRGWQSKTMHTNISLSIMLHSIYIATPSHWIISTPLHIAKQFTMFHFAQSHRRKPQLSCHTLEIISCALTLHSSNPLLSTLLPFPLQISAQVPHINTQLILPHAPYACPHIQLRMFAIKIRIPHSHTRIWIDGVFHTFLDRFLILDDTFRFLHADQEREGNFVAFFGLTLFVNTGQQLNVLWRGNIEGEIV